MIKITIMIMISSSLSCANWVAASPKRNLAKNSWFNNLKRRYFPKIDRGYDQYYKGKVQAGRQQNKVSNRELWRKIYWSNTIKDNLTTKCIFCSLWFLSCFLGLFLMPIPKKEKVFSSGFPVCLLGHRKQRSAKCKEKAGYNLVANH